MPRRRMRQPEPVIAQPASTAKPQVELSAYALRDSWLGIFPPNVWPRPEVASTRTGSEGAALSSLQMSSGSAGWVEGRERLDRRRRRP